MPYGPQVYAVDLLGFGYSEKARLDYTNAEVGGGGGWCRG